jgi:hypothetical protein
MDTVVRIAEELTTPMSKKETTRSADLRYEVKKVLRSLYIPVTDGVPSVVGRNSGVSPLIIKDGENKRDRGLITFHYLVHEENLCAKSPETANIATATPPLPQMMCTLSPN